MTTTNDRWATVRRPDGVILGYQRVDGSQSIEKLEGVYGWRFYGNDYRTLQTAKRVADDRLSMDRYRM